MGQGTGSQQRNNETSLVMTCVADNADLEINGFNVPYATNSNIYLNANVVETENVNEYQLIKIYVNNEFKIVTSYEQTKLSVIYGVKEASTINIVYADANKVEISTTTEGSDEGLVISLPKDVSKDQKHERTNTEVIVQNNVEELSLKVYTDLLTGGKNDFVGFFIGDEYVTNSSIVGDLIKVQSGEDGKGSYIEYSIKSSIANSVQVVVKKPVPVQIQNITNQTFKIVAVEGYEKNIISNGSVNLYEGEWIITQLSGDEEITINGTTYNVMTKECLEKIFVGCTITETIVDNKTIFKVAISKS